MPVFFFSSDSSAVTHSLPLLALARRSSSSCEYPFLKIPPSLRTRGGSSTSASASFWETCLWGSMDLISLFISLDLSGSSLRNCLRSFSVSRLERRLSRSRGEIEPCPSRDNNLSTSWNPLRMSRISRRLSVLSNNS